MKNKVLGLAVSLHSIEVEEVMCGHILKVKVQYENVKMILVNVYAPVLSIERMNFFLYFVQCFT